MAQRKQRADINVYANVLKIYIMLAIKTAATERIEYVNRSHCRFGYSHGPRLFYSNFRLSLET